MSDDDVRVNLDVHDVNTFTKDQRNLKTRGLTTPSVPPAAFFVLSFPSNGINPTFPTASRSKTYVLVDPRLDIPYSVSQIIDDSKDTLSILWR